MSWSRTCSDRQLCATSTEGRSATIVFRLMLERGTADKFNCIEFLSRLTSDFPSVESTTFLRTTEAVLLSLCRRKRKP